MAANANPQVLHDRTEIHKSCKAIESLVNILNDYAEAASAIIALQKKLARALKDAAGLKSTGEIAANAFGTCATIFEMMSEVDSKHAKLADKECENVSNEVKKWFKKLAKEEKLHDEKMANANARIKAAGQAYEKKSKKNTRDISEEHARYINLISSLGPEISEEKYTHASSVSEKQSAITHTVASCLLRVADTEWISAWERVRRFAPTVGVLAQWRALCEGGYTGSLPKDLQDSDPPLPLQRPKEPEESPKMSPAPSYSPETQRTANYLEAPSRSPVPAYATPDNQSRAGSSDQDHHTVLRTPTRAPTLTPTYSNSPADVQTPLESPKPPFASNGANSKWDDSVTSITSLSVFPTPPTLRMPRQPLSPPLEQTTLPPLSESPTPELERGIERVLHHSPSRIRRTSLNIPDTYIPPTPASTASLSIARNPANTEKETAADTSAVDEFGGISKTSPVDQRNGQIERKESVGVVAAMRSRYVNGSTSPTARVDSPRAPVALPLSNGSVSDLAHRYTPSDSPPATSPLREREQPYVRMSQRMPANTEEKERALQARERDLDARSQALDQVALQARMPPLRQDTASSSNPDYVRPRRTSYQSPSAMARTDHASSCGCATCSVAHYSRPPSALHIAQTQALKDKEKKPGWIRRLSMPVGNAFSSSSPTIENLSKRDYRGMSKDNSRSPGYGHSRMGSRSVTDLALGRR